MTTQQIIDSIGDIVDLINRKYPFPKSFSNYSLRMANDHDCIGLVIKIDDDLPQCFVAERIHERIFYEDASKIVSHIYSRFESLRGAAKQEIDCLELIRIGA
jgi:hypothetical protein